MVERPVSRQPLKIIGVLLLVFGVGFLVLAYGAHAIDAHSRWYLPQFYGSEHAEGRIAVDGSTPYERLFRYATVLTEGRGRAQLALAFALAGWSLSLGAVCLWWHRDRQKLKAQHIGSRGPTI